MNNYLQLFTAIQSLINVSNKVFIVHSFSLNTHVNMHRKKFEFGAVIIDGHVQGLSNVRALGERGIPIIVLDTNICIAQYSKYCKKFFKCPSYNSPKFISFLMELGKKENLHGWTIFPSNDHIVLNLSKNKEELSKIFKVNVPEYAFYSRIYDKLEFTNNAKSTGIPVPMTILGSQVEEFNHLPYPLILKGRESLTFFKATNKKALIINSNSELHTELKKIQNVIPIDKVLLQEVIPFNSSKDVWSFTCFAIDGETKSFWIGKKIREHPIKFGTATLAVSDYNSIVENYGKRIAESLKYTGVCEIEFIQDKNDGDFKLIEMNARTWLWVGLAKYCGINYALMVYNFMNNIPFKYPKGYLAGVQWINHTIDFIFALKSIFNGELQVRDYIKSIKGKKIGAIFSRNDIMPSVMFFILFVYIVIKRR